MKSQTNILAQEAAPWLGDPHPFLAQLGAPEDLAAPALTSSVLTARPIQSLSALRSFLHAYQAEVLIPLELPLILRAHGHASRQEARELVALDQALLADPKLREFVVASCRVGQRQLGRLRSLRDQRIVQRYLAAIDRGEARGWHTLVYGLSLAVFSMPLRQGLVSYAAHTVGGFIENAAGPLGLTVEQCRDTHAQVTSAVPHAVQALLVPDRTPPLRLT